MYICRREQKTQKCLQERLAALDEQKKLIEEALEQQLKRKTLDDEQVGKRAEFRHELDMFVEGKKKVAAEENQQSQAAEEKIRLYLKAKKVIRTVWSTRVCMCVGRAQ